MTTKQTWAARALPLAFVALVPGCTETDDLASDEQAETTAPPDRPDEDKHHLEFDPGAENPDVPRAEARADGTLVATPRVTLPAPDEALKTLRSTLGALATQYPAESTERAGLDQLVGTLELVERGEASLSIRQFCLGGGGLTRWLSDQRQIDRVTEV